MMNENDPSSPGFDEAAEARELEAFFRQQDPVDTTAADWHTRREQGLSVADEIRFQQWLAASPAHVAAFERLEHSISALRAVPSEKIASVRAAHSAAASHPFAKPGQGERTGARRKRMEVQIGSRLPATAFQPRRVLIAFCCMVVLAVGIGWPQFNQQETFSRNYVVERGQRQTVTLPEGTELTFDADTQAQVTLYRDRREVRISDGQILFNVAPDSEKPFLVLAGPARVTVVGTQFSVRYRHAGMDAGAVRVAVARGKVRVNDAYRSQVDNASAINLAAGQGIRMSATGAFGDIANVTPGSVALWRQGMVRFENTPLGDALLELERYGSTGLLIADPAVAAMPIGGSFKIRRPDEFAKMVSQILPVKLVKTASGKTEIALAR